MDFPCNETISATMSKYTPRQTRQVVVSTPHSSVHIQSDPKNAVQMNQQELQQGLQYEDQYEDQYELQREREEELGQKQQQELKKELRQPLEKPQKREVVVLSLRNEKFRLCSKDEVKPYIKDHGLWKQKLPRAPWNKKVINCTPFDESRQMTRKNAIDIYKNGRLPLRGLGRLFWIKRLLGIVTEMYTFPGNLEDLEKPKTSTQSTSKDKDSQNNPEAKSARDDA
ncbi:hypothetical protein IWZ01DRAFT_52867 [Phyllosticta capitalensis]